MNTRADKIVAVPKEETPCKLKTQQNFWNPPTLEDIVENSSASTRDEIETLKADFWPADESADALIDYIYKQRQNDTYKT